MNKEILLVVEAVSNEKGVDREVIFQAIEAALEIATKKKADDMIDVKVEIDRKVGDYATSRRWLVIADDMEEEDGDGGHATMILSEAQKRQKNIKVGEYIIEAMESVEFGRIAAQKAKQVIIQKVLEAERAQIVSAYQEKIGTLINGTVKKVTRDFIVLDRKYRSERKRHHGIIVSDQLPLRELLSRTLRCLSRRKPVDVRRNVVWLQDFK